MDQRKNTEYVTLHGGKFFFCCQPTEGIRLDASIKHIELFIEYLKGLFSPKDGSVLIPNYFGTNSSNKEIANFDQVSTNLGKIVQQSPQDNAAQLKKVEEANKELTALLKAV